MKKDINGKYINSHRFVKNFIKVALNDINNITSNKRINKRLKIDIPNSNNGFNSITNISTKKNINSKKFITLDEKNININTETIFSKREITPNKKSKSKNKNEKTLYGAIIKKKNKPVKLIKDNNKISKNEKNVIPNKNRFTKKNNRYKEKDKLPSFDNFTNNINKKTGRSNDSSNIINNNAHILSINNINYSKSRNNIKSIFPKEDNKTNKFIYTWRNSINCKRYTNINDGIFYNNKKLTKYQNFLDNSKQVKKRVKRINKSENKIIFNSYNNSTNKSYIKRYKLKSEPKINIYRKREGKNIRDATDSTETQNFLNKNIIIKKVKYYNLKIGKRDEINQQKNQNSNININNSKKIKEKENFLKDKPKERKAFKSCDIFCINYKKKRKNIKKISFPQKRINLNTINNQYNHSFIDNNSKTIHEKPNDIKYIKYIKNKKAKSDVKTYDFGDECFNNILESDIVSYKKINKIKTNRFEVKKPNEENLKYTILKENNDDTNISESPKSKISAIIIGNIDGYNDIFEKDKINNLLNRNLTNNQYNDSNLSNNNLNYNQGKQMKISFNDSSETEKKIINMINFECESDNLSTNDFKYSKYNPLNEKKNRKLIKTEIIKGRINQEKKKANIGRPIKIQNEKYNPIRFREKIIDKINVKIAKQTTKHLNYKPNIKLNNISNIKNQKKPILDGILKTKTTINSNSNITSKKNKIISNDKLKPNQNNLAKKKSEQNNNNENCLVF